MSTDSIDIQLEIVNSIIETWEGFLEQVRSDAGNQGVAEL